MLAPYVKQIIRLEEEAAANLTGQILTSDDLYPDEVPERARFLDIVASRGAGNTGESGLSCSRRVQGSEGEIELLEYECDEASDECKLKRSQIIRTDDLVPSTNE
jgi:hypothetical protein